MCASCLPVWRRAEAAADKLHVSLSLLTKGAPASWLLVAEAFASRDDGRGAYDSTGAWHSGVAMQRTCKWEMRRDSSSITALNLAAVASTDLGRLSAIGRGLCFTSTQSAKVKQAAAKKRLGQREMMPGESFAHYLNHLDTQHFILPFYYYLAMQVVVERRDEMIEGLMRT